MQKLLKKYENMEIDTLKTELAKLTISEIVEIANQFGYEGNLKQLSKCPKDVIILMTCQKSPFNKKEDKTPSTTTGNRNSIWTNKLKNLDAFVKNISNSEIDFKFHIQKCSEIPMPRGILIDVKTFVAICSNYQIDDNNNELYYKGFHYSFNEDKTSLEARETGASTGIMNSSTGFKHKADMNCKQQWGKLFATMGIFCKAYVYESDKELSDQTTLYDKDPKKTCDQGYDVVIGMYPLGSELSPKIGKAKKSQQIPIDNFLSEFAHDRDHLMNKSNEFKTSIEILFATKELQNSQK